jgi:hypothetical protein
MLRLAGNEAFAKEIFVDQAALVRNAGISPTEFRDAARTLESLGVLRYTPPSKLSRSAAVWQVSLTGERRHIHTVDVGIRRIESLFEDSLSKLREMANYASNWSCRRNTILRYFGERPRTAYCERCDWCVSRANGMTSDSPEWSA